MTFIFGSAARCKWTSSVFVLCEPLDQVWAPPVSCGGHLIQRLTGDEQLAMSSWSDVMAFDNLKCPFYPWFSQFEWRHHHFPIFKSIFSEIQVLNCSPATQHKPISVNLTSLTYKFIDINFPKPQNMHVVSKYTTLTLKT